MKIITRFESAWDAVAGRYVTVSEDSFEYEGPLARCDLGGSSSTTTTTVPPKTETELAVDALTLKQLQRQEAQAAEFDPIIKQYIQDLQAESAARKATGITPEQRATADKEAFERSQRMAKVEEELSTIQLEQIKQGGKATPEQIELINAATGAAQKTGEADIERFRTATLRQINEEISTASGLRPTDTPIVRLSERAGEEAARQQGQLTSRLAETSAMARLNFPLASAKLISDIAAGQQGLQFAAQQFSEQLRQRAEDNRFRLFQGGQAGNISPIGFGASLAGERFASAGRTTSTSGSSLGEIGQLAGGIGGLMSAAPAFGRAVFSDRRLKRDVVHIGELQSGIPVYAFRFIGFEGWHIGVLADEVIGIIPEAVSEHESGYLQVRYDLLH